MNFIHSTKLLGKNVRTIIAYVLAFSRGEYGFSMI